MAQRRVYGTSWCRYIWVLSGRIQSHHLFRLQHQQPMQRRRPRAREVMRSKRSKCWKSWPRRQSKAVKTQNDPIKGVKSSTCNCWCCRVVHRSCTLDELAGTKYAKRVLLPNSRASVKDALFVSDRSYSAAGRPNGDLAVLFAFNSISIMIQNDAKIDEVLWTLVSSDNMGWQRSEVTVCSTLFPSHCGHFNMFTRFCSKKF